VDGRVKPGQDVGAAAKNSLNNSYRYKRQAESWHKSKFVVFIRNVGSKIALSCGGRRTSVQSRFLQPGARVAQSGKRSQGFFIPIGCNPLKRPDSKK
jgi:hypothetical protein